MKSKEDIPVSVLSNEVTLKLPTRCREMHTDSDIVILRAFYPALPSPAQPLSQTRTPTPTPSPLPKLSPPLEFHLKSHSSRPTLPPAPFLLPYPYFPPFSPQNTPIYSPPVRNSSPPRAPTSAELWGLAVIGCRCRRSRACCRVVPRGVPPSVRSGVAERWGDSGGGGIWGGREGWAGVGGEGMEGVGGGRGRGWRKWWGGGWGIVLKGLGRRVGRLLVRNVGCRLLRGGGRWV